MRQIRMAKSNNSILLVFASHLEASSFVDVDGWDGCASWFFLRLSVSRYTFGWPRLVPGRFRGRRGSWVNNTLLIDALLVRYFGGMLL